MNDVSQQQPHEDPVSNENNHGSEPVLCIKQEPLEIEPDDLSNDPLGGITDAPKAPLAKEGVPLEVTAIDGNLLQLGIKRKRGRPKKSVERLETEDDGELGPAGKRRSKSKKLSFDCPEENCTHSDKTMHALVSHIYFQHGESRAKEVQVQAKKKKPKAKKVPSEDEVARVESITTAEVVDVSGFVVRIEKTYYNSKGKVLYTCSRCRAAFLKLEKCEEHVAKVHTSLRRYTCSDCGRGFDRALDLGEHTKVHTRERPFKCPVAHCNYTAAWSSTLVRHVRRRHKDYDGDLSRGAIATGKRSERKRKIGSDKQVESGEPAATIEDEPRNGDPSSANEKERRYSTSEDASIHPDSLLVQNPPVEDVEYDDGQLDLFEEANIIDNRDEETPHYRCKICSTDFENLFAIKRHINEAHMNVKKRTCKLCGVTLTHSCNMSVHMRSHSGERPFKCKECGTSFITKSDLKRHGRRFNHECGVQVKEYKCITCKTRFESTSKLEKHVSIHVPRSMDLSIDSFDLTPYEEAKLKIIEYTTELTESYVFRCTICGMLHSALSEAKSHVTNDHKLVKQLSCIYCGLTSSSRTALNAHLPIHEDNNKISRCPNPNCNYVADQYFSLQRHIRDCPHTPRSTTARKCTICTLEFRELTLLRTHFRTFHKLGKSYSCLHCEYSFASLEILTEHLQSHGAIQSVVRCPLENCQFTVTTEEDRAQHQQWHQKKNNPPAPRPFACALCGSDFEKNCGLTRHMKTVHFHPRPVVPQKGELRPDCVGQGTTSLSPPQDPSDVR